MVELLEEVVARLPEEDIYLGDKYARALRAQLAALPADAPVTERVNVLAELAQAELRQGREERAIELLRRALELVPPGDGAAAEGRRKLLFRLGVAWMRRGETLNCCATNDPESCILPIRGGGVHTRPEPSRRAIACFREVLAETEPDSEEHLGALWLLNLAFMTVGGHPDEVPAESLIPPAAFASDEPFPRLENVAARAGLDTFSQSGGAAADDFDGDGDLDLAVSSWDPREQMRYFENRDGAFVERTEAAGLRGIVGGLNLVPADYDNDGDRDVLVLRGAWRRTGGRLPNSLLRNEGDGRFVDVTLDAGLGGVHYPTQTAAWADYDRDGDLDLYVGNESGYGLEAPSQLFRNEGDGTFTDVALQAGVTNGRYAKGVAWGDVDGDLDPDLYVSNLDGRNRLYRNDGDGTFTDVAEAAGVSEPIVSFPTWFFDYDDDGDLDLFVGAYGTQIHDLAASALGRPFAAERARLYENDGTGRFRDVAGARGLTRPTQPMGSNFGDLDGDGWLDFYLGTGNVPYRDLMPNVMMRNRAGKGFADVTTAAGLGHLQKGHAVVFADLDHDGDLDLFEQMGGALRGDAFSDALYENPGFGHRWIALELVGTRTNRCALGARVAVEIEPDGGGRRTLYRHVGTGGSFGASPFRQVIGLGRAEAVVGVAVLWPVTGETQRFAGLALDRAYRLTEGRSAPEPLPYAPMRLGGGRR